MNSLSGYLSEYYKYHKDIVLIYRDNNNKGYPRGIKYLGEGYNPLTKYNHRIILPNEIVIEYDLDDKEVNKKYANIVASRLRKDGFKLSKWDSGNKSVHVHLLINLREVSNPSVLKRVLVRYYTKGLTVPDLQLCSPNHLIRAEYGLHEKTGKCKSLIFKDSDYPYISEIPQHIWDLYRIEMIKQSNRMVTVDTTKFQELPGIKFLFKTEEFKKLEDGRGRAILLLVYVLKHKFTLQETQEYIWLWYKYSSGAKLDKVKVYNQVKYYYSKNYGLRFYEKYLNELLSDINREDLIKVKNEI